MSEWKTRVKRCVDEILPITNIVQSSLIMELALSICTTGAELFAPHVAFVVCTPCPNKLAIFFCIVPLELYSCLNPSD